MTASLSPIAADVPSDETKSDSLRLSRKTLTSVAFLIAIAIALRLAFLVYKFHYGYLDNNMVLLSPDEVGYLFAAKNDAVEFRIGSHWLYPLLNATMFKLMGDLDSTYLALCGFNIVLSVLTPFAMLPLIRSFCQNHHSFNRLFVAVVTVLSFWPASIWLSTANLKDTMLGFLIASYISAMVVYFGDRAIVKAPRQLMALVILLVTLFALFSLRSYVAAFLVIASSVFMVFGLGGLIRKATLLAILGGILGFSGTWSVVMEFFNYENNWLLNSYLQEEINNRIMAEGENALVINRNPVTIGLGAIKFMLNPLPTLNVSDFNQAMLVAQTAFSLLFVLPFVAGFRQLKEHRMVVLLGSYMLLVLTFYSIAESFSGPRQRFATMDIFSILLTAAAVTKAQPSAHTSGDKKFTLNVVVGLMLNVVLLAFTSRMSK